MITKKISTIYLQNKESLKNSIKAVYWFNQENFKTWITLMGFSPFNLKIQFYFFFPIEFIICVIYQLILYHQSTNSLMKGLEFLQFLSPHSHFTLKTHDEGRQNGQRESDSKKQGGKFLPRVFVNKSVLKPSWTLVVVISVLWVFLFNDTRLISEAWRFNLSDRES